MGGHPARLKEGFWQLGETVFPTAASDLSELAVGITAREGPLGGPAALAEGFHQVGLMVTFQPDSPSSLHERPGELHGFQNPGASVNHIPAQHKLVFAGKLVNQSLQWFCAAVNVPDDPMVSRT
jgi:hypothetical protein